MVKYSTLIDVELEAVLKKSKDNIVITDGKGTVLRASPNCFDIYGKKVKDLVGRNVEQLEKEDVFSPSVTKAVIQKKKEIQIMQHTSTGRVVMAEEVEQRWLKRAVRQCDTTYEMAEFLGISQSSVVRKLRKYDIDS